MDSSSHFPLPPRQDQEIGPGACPEPDAGWAEGEGAATGWAAGREEPAAAAWRTETAVVLVAHSAAEAGAAGRAEFLVQSSKKVSSESEYTVCSELTFFALLDSFLHHPSALIPWPG